MSTDHCYELARRFGTRASDRVVTAYVVAVELVDQQGGILPPVPLRLTVVDKLIEETERGAVDLKRLCQTAMTRLLELGVPPRKRKATEFETQKSTVLIFFEPTLVVNVLQY